MDLLHQKKAATAGYLSHGKPVSFQPGDPAEVAIELEKGMEFSCRALEQSAARQLVEQSLAELVGHPVRCAFQIAEPEPAASPAQAPKPSSAYVNTVLELFEGRVLPGEG